VLPFIAAQILGGILDADAGAILGVRGAIAVDPGMRQICPDVSSPGIASLGEPRSRTCQAGTGAPQGRSARVGIDSRQQPAREPAVVSRR